MIYVPGLDNVWFQLFTRFSVSCDSRIYDITKCADSVQILFGIECVTFWPVLFGARELILLPGLLDTAQLGAPARWAS